MRKSIILVLIVITSVLSSICCSACKKFPYPLTTGTYCFETATITNKVTNEITEKSFDDILTDKQFFREWGNLFSFQIYINEKTECFRNSDNRYFVLNEGLAFEVIAKNKLQLHFPYWTGYDLYTYDVVVILSCQQTYAVSLCAE